MDDSLNHGQGPFHALKHAILYKTITYQTKGEDGAVCTRHRITRRFRWPRRKTWLKLAALLVLAVLPFLIYAVLTRMYKPPQPGVSVQWSE